MNTVCAACGAAFHCGFRAGESDCWCAKLPKLMPMPAETGTSCLCETCLRAEIAKRMSSTASSTENASHA
jgi:hypothetical protein